MRASEMENILKDTLVVVLAGGHGSRLQPLTKERAKPAVPFGGKYRIIDFSLSNCVHSGLRRVLVLSQYKSHSLQKHLRDGWSIYNPELSEYITIVPPQMRRGENWYGGTADAIYQNLYLIERSSAKYVLLLSADHIYRMDYLPLLEAHAQSGADMTVSYMDTPITDASNFGVLDLGEDGVVKDFAEKPQSPVPAPYDDRVASCSMGVYVFSTEALGDIVTKDSVKVSSSHDFGKDIIPGLVEQGRLNAYRFGGEKGRVSADNYWRDVGTIDSYYQSNYDLLKPIPPINLYQRDWPIRTYTGQNPPARTAQGESGNEGIFINSIIAAGTVISGASVQNSILFENVYIDDEATVFGAILFNGVKIGKRAQIGKCIIDKHVEVPDDEVIGFDLEKDRQRFEVSPEGVVVIPKGYRF